MPFHSAALVAGSQANELTPRHDRKGSSTSEGRGAEPTDDASDTQRSHGGPERRDSRRPTLSKSKTKMELLKDDLDFDEFLKQVKQVNRTYDPDATIQQKIKYFRRAYFLRIHKRKINLDWTFNLVIVLYFVFKCIQAQFGNGKVAQIFELCFEVIFILDVASSLAANWFFKYWTKFWNVFDFFTVGLTILDMAKVLTGGQWVVLRIFRVFDALKRHRDFKILAIATWNSMQKAGFLFLGLFMLMSIYSILGVSFFGDDYEDHFGTYSKAMFTMLQVLTGDSWASAVARECLTIHYTFAYFFFMSYIVLVSIILMNVVQAVFLDAYLNAHNEAAKQIEDKKMKHIFDIFDADGSDTIEREEVFKMVDSLNKFGYDFDPHKMFQRIDRGQRGSSASLFSVDGGLDDNDKIKITFEDFLRAKQTHEDVNLITLDTLNAKIDSLTLDLGAKSGYGDMDAITRSHHSKYVTLEMLNAKIDTLAEDLEAKLDKLLERAGSGDKGDKEEVIE